jgi:ketosteroid isomerase-like protein
VSQENGEVVKQAMDAFNRRDVDAFLALVTPEFEWFPSMVSLVEGGSFRGREGVADYFRESRNTWAELSVLGDEFRDLGDRVLVLGRTGGTGRGSGVEADAPIGMVFDFRATKLSRVRAYLDHGEALRAAGLAE